MDVAQIIQIALSNGVPSALLVWVSIAFFRGDLVSKREHSETRADRDRAIADAHKKDELLREILDQYAILVTSGKVSVEVARALPQVLDTRRTTDDSSG